MITSKELQYVSMRANRIPMPGTEYSKKVLEEIKNCYELYNKKYKNKEYSIIFSNSEEIDFEILTKNLCHMMGIDYNNIKGEYFDDYRENVFGTSAADFTSYDLLGMIIENMDKVAAYDNNANNTVKAVNYYKSAIKCEIFNKLTDFDKFNFAAINYIGNRDDIEYDKQKLLFISSNEAVTPYFMMGIKQEEDTSKYVVASLMAPDNPKYFFENQEVVIPTQILVNDNQNLEKKVATAEEKMRLLTMYSNIINKYNLPNRINIYGDYENMLNELCNQKVYKLK